MTQIWSAAAHAEIEQCLCALGTGVGTAGACLPLVLSSGGCLALSAWSRAGKGVKELSDVSSSVKSLSKSHLVGRQWIQQDFCRPDGECFCQGFTISINKHTRGAFGTF